MVLLFNKVEWDLDRCSFHSFGKDTLSFGGGSFIVGCWYVFEYFCVCGNQKFKTSVSGSGMARDLEVAFEKKNNNNNNHYSSS